MEVSCERSDVEAISNRRAPVAAPERRLSLAFFLLCLAGIGLSVELTRIHVLAHTDPNYHPICAISESANCEIVALSPYAVFAGLPVSVWGIAGYALMGALALWGWSKRRLHASWPLGVLLTLTALAAFASAALAFISASRIGSVCLFCLGCYVINAALLAMGAVAWKRSRAPLSHLLARDLKAWVAHPALAAALTVGGLAPLGALGALLPTYWQAPGWADLPELPSGTDLDGHPWIGAREPSLTIVEFSDYECPHCRSAHKAIRLLVAKHPDRIRLVHRHLPLDKACHPLLNRPFHTHACLFAEATECAALQGRFWEMNDALFSIQETVKAARVDPLALAVRLGLDRTEFRRCLEHHVTAGRVAGDLREAVARQLTGTPTFLVGDQVFLGRLTEAELEQLRPGLW
jgi:protein-disulfide isomerase/uncharacterized membrane protein